MGFLTAMAVATALSVAGRSNATPSMAADGAFVAIAWTAALPSGITDVFLATSKDGGRTFTAPLRVNDVDGDARVNGEQPPRVVLDATEPGQTPQITIVWTTKGTSGTKIVFARSKDRGRTFSRAAVVPGGDAAGNRGWEAASRSFVVWLDHREMAPHDGDMATMHHAHTGTKPDGVAMAARSKLYVSTVDGSVPPRTITGGVCYCCKTAITSTSDGAVFLAWRHVYPGNIRDIAFTMSRDGGRTFSAPSRVSEDKWVLEGCPDDGPAMSVAPDKRVHVVWPTLVTDASADGAEPTIALFYAASGDGRQFTPRERIPTEGTPHHPQIARNADGSLTIVWDEIVNGTRRAVMARAVAGENGSMRFTRRVLSEGDPAIYPVVVATNEGPLVAWTSGLSSSSAIRVVRP